MQGEVGLRRGPQPRVDRDRARFVRLRRRLDAHADETPLETHAAIGLDQFLDAKRQRRRANFFNARADQENVARARMSHSARTKGVPMPQSTFTR